MSFYRKLVTAVATLGLATCVFAADENVNTQAAPDSQPAAVQGATADQSKVNINAATSKDLAKVDGINKSKANAIVSYRKKHGDFKSLDELKEVKGFKKLDEEAMRKIQDQLAV